MVGDERYSDGGGRCEVKEGGEMRGYGDDGGRCEVAMVGDVRVW